MGRPGAYVMQLVKAALCRTVAFVVAATVTFLGAVMVGLDRLFAGGAVGLCVAALLGATGYALWQARLHINALERAWVGARSERRTAQALRRSNVTVVVHGALLGAGGDADHVLLGPCVAVVETKTGTGSVRVEGGRLMAGRRAMRGDPTGQARRQAAALGKRIRCHAQAIVCISDMTSRPFQHQGVWVCSPATVADVIAGLPAVMDASTALAVAATVDAGR